MFERCYSLVYSLGLNCDVLDCNSM